MLANILHPYIIAGHENAPELSVAYWLLLIHDNPENAGALEELGCAYYYGYGVSQDKEKAFLYFKKAAELDDNEALYNLGISLLTGQGTDPDISQGLALLKRAAAETELGDGRIYAQLALGDCIREGLGFPQNDENASEYYLKAIWPFLGLTAENLMGDDSVLEDLTRPDIPEILLQAALLGNETALSQFDNLPEADTFLSSKQDALLECISLGLKEAVRWADDDRLLSLQSSDPSDAGRMAALGFLHNWGYFADNAHRSVDNFHFGEADPDTAQDWWIKAARLGHAPAAFQLYLQFLKEDPEESLDWLILAAENGMIKAWYMLGSRYLDEGDEAEAAHWLVKATEVDYRGIDPDLLVDYYYEYIYQEGRKDSPISDDLIRLWCRKCIDSLSSIDDEAQEILNWLD